MQGATQFNHNIHNNIRRRNHPIIEFLRDRYSPSPSTLKSLNKGSLKFKCHKIYPLRSVINKILIFLWLELGETLFHGSDQYQSWKIGGCWNLKKDFSCNWIDFYKRKWFKLKIQIEKFFGSNSDSPSPKSCTSKFINYWNFIKNNIMNRSRSKKVVFNWLHDLLPSLSLSFQQTT